MKETKEYKVSIVTAVYNVEEYLEEMVESIIAQTIGFENVQLILVNDGSEDDSGSVCDKYKEKYPDNVVVVHKENGGVSSARNEGLKYVKGKYVNFTDPDDMLEENALDMMYDYLEKYGKWIDVVAIKLRFLGEGYGEHPLNYKFNTTRMIELRKEYKHIQLSMSSTLIKTECFENRRFDLELSYAEDAQLLLDILLDKMRYGVLSETCYWYRKRAEGGSALDTGRNRPCFYIPIIERFILRSLENALERKGYIPYFIQYSCMYDLQYRLRQNPFIKKGVLTEGEEKKYRELVVKAFQYIDNKIVSDMKNLGGNYKTAILTLKEENLKKKELVSYPDDVKICIENLIFTAAASYTIYYDFIQIFSDKIILEGYVRYAVELEDVEILLRVEGKNSESLKYKAELIDREDQCAFCMDKMITDAKGFRVVVNREELPDESEMKICMSYQGNEIAWKNISFGKFFPLSKKLKQSYFYQDGLVLTYLDYNLILKKTTGKEIVRECERELKKEVKALENKRLFRAWMVRKLYFLVKPWKKKEIWLISDRVKRADDNGEALFTYMNKEGKNLDIKTYFALDKSAEDYNRLKGIGKVVPFWSLKYTITALLADKVISSQGEDYLFAHGLDLAYLYKDLIHQQKFVFLQHGVTKDDLSRWLRRFNKNISMFVTTTRMEYQSILEYPYYYDEDQVKCTGFPRYDYLYDDTEGKNIITFMPTWRSYLVGKLDAKTNNRVLSSEFAESSYCKMYQQLFSNTRLRDAAQRLNYKIQLMMHPAMPEECISYFGCEDHIEILDRNTRYRKLFAESKLIVTDYSSTVFDFAYLRKPVLYYQQDVDDFFSGKHTYDKGYFDYERDGFGEVEYTAESLVDRIIEYMENGCRLKEKYRDRTEQTFPYQDKNNCKRVCDEIIKL